MTPRVHEIVTLEMSGAIADWEFAEDGAIHILLSKPVFGCVCREAHAYFVNRHGRTRYVLCDDGYVMLLSSIRSLNICDGQAIGVLQ